MKALDAATAAKRLLAGSYSFTIMLAMSPMQPGELCRAVIEEALERDVLLRVLTADLTGRFEFLPSHAHEAVRRRRLRFVSVAGSFPREIGPFVDYVPGGLWDADRMLREGTLEVDAYLVRVGEPNAAGACALGQAVAFTPSALEGARQCVFQLDPGVGFFPGDGGAPAAAASFLVEGDAAALAPSRPRAFSVVQTQIAERLAELIPDGATVQLGLGAIPEAIIPALRGKRDLGLHSGVVAPQIAELIDAGVINGRRKSRDVGRHVTTGIVGDGSVASLADPASGMQLEPLGVTHHPRTLVEQRCLWAINSALEVDLTGQINAEYAGGARIASAGGQGDFARWAHVSPGGASVVALPSRTSKGVPRIVAFLAKPHAVTTTKGDVDFVVTEFGTARLSGSTAEARVAALIAVAHPGDRAGLQDAWSAEA